MAMLNKLNNQRLIYNGQFKDSHGDGWPQANLANLLDMGQSSRLSTWMYLTWFYMLVLHKNLVFCENADRVMKTYNIHLSYIMYHIYIL
jgi:hypothetical protein